MGRNYQSPANTTGSHRTTNCDRQSRSTTQENGSPEGKNDDELLIPLEMHSTPEDGSPRE
jgi:hypothetical protein